MKIRFATMKMEWYNDGSNDSRSHAIKILLRTDQPRWHFCFSPKMFSYLPVLLSWSEWSKHVFNKISEFKHSCLRSSYLISFKCCLATRCSLNWHKIITMEIRSEISIIWSLLPNILRMLHFSFKFFVRGGTSNILHKLSYLHTSHTGLIRISQIFPLNALHYFRKFSTVYSLY